MTAYAAFFALSLVDAVPAHAQQPATAADSLRVRLESLVRQVDSLRQVVSHMEAQRAAADTGDALARIRAAAAEAAGVDTTAAAQEVEFVGRQRNLSALNPEISVNADVFAFSRSVASTTDNFVPREFEVSFISNLDPYSRAKVFLAHHTGGGEIAPFGEAHEGEEAGHGGEVEIEEGYVEWVGLPAGLGLTVGRFRQRFGRLNRWHAHALPAQQLPLPYFAFLGEEGLAQTGVSLHWLAPIHGFGTWEVWTEVTRSSSEPLFGESRGLSALARLNAFWDLSPASYFEIGLSGITGGREAEPGANGGTATGNRLWGVDATFDWRPPDRALYRGFTLHGGAVVNRRVFEDEPDATAFGAFVIGDYKFARRWILGARYEYTENPDDPAESAWLVAPALTWWQSEFVRLRASYEIFRGPAERFGQFVLQATFAMGPHKHESY